MPLTIRASWVNLITLSAVSSCNWESSIKLTFVRRDLQVLHPSLDFRCGRRHGIVTRGADRMFEVQIDHPIFGRAQRSESKDTTTANYNRLLWFQFNIRCADEIGLEL